MISDAIYQSQPLTELKKKNLCYQLTITLVVDPFEDSCQINGSALVSVAKMLDCNLQQ